MAETRKVIDCRRFPAEKPCSIAISGSEEDVVDLAVLHATSVHGHADSPELRQQIRSMLEDEGAALQAKRRKASLCGAGALARRL